MEVEDFSRVGSRVDGSRGFELGWKLRVLELTVEMVVEVLEFGMEEKGTRVD